MQKLAHKSAYPKDLQLVDKYLNLNICRSSCDSGARWNWEELGRETRIKNPKIYYLIPIYYMKKRIYVKLNVNDDKFVSRAHWLYWKMLVGVGFGHI